MKTKRVSGWGIPGSIRIENYDVNIHLCGVCTCKWHKEQCASRNRCEKLFGRGGSIDAEQKLARLMRASGKPMPKSWRDGCHWRMHTTKVYKAKEAAIDKFEREFFARCRPVMVEVRTR